MAIVLRIVKWLVLAVVVVAALGYGTLYVVNWRDRDASEAAVKMSAIYTNHAAVAEQDNAFLYAMGFDAPQGQDPLQQGLARVAWFQGIADKPGNVEEPQRAVYDPAAHRPEAMKRVFDACADVTAACAGALQANEQGIAEWVAVNGWLLARYQALQAHPAWLAIIPPDSRAPMPRYGALLEAQRVLLLRAWLLAGQGDAAGVRALLDPDVQFWRHTLAASGTLLTKTVAAAALIRHYTWGNLVLRRLPSDQAVAAMPESWLQPLSNEERSFQRVLAGEWKLFDTMLRQAKTGSAQAFPVMAADEDDAVQRITWRLIRPFLQVQESSNRYAELLTKVAETLDVATGAFPAALESAQRLEHEYQQSQPPMSRLYNIVGDAISSIAEPSFSSFAPRVYDVEGVRRAALLAVQLRGRGVTKEALAQQLVSADLRDPYTEKPFAWDEASGSLVFDGLTQGERGHHALLY